MGRFRGRVGWPDINVEDFCEELWVQCGKKSKLLSWNHRFLLVFQVLPPQKAPARTGYWLATSAAPVGFLFANCLRSKSPLRFNNRKLVNQNFWPTTILVGNFGGKNLRQQFHPEISGHKFHSELPNEVLRRTFWWAQFQSTWYHPATGQNPERF